jgi:hypothetical protein
MSTDAEFFAENAGYFPNGVYHDDSEYDLISLVVVDNVPIEVCPLQVTSISSKPPDVDSDCERSSLQQY